MQLKLLTVIKNSLNHRITFAIFAVGFIGIVGGAVLLIVSAPASPSIKPE